jgi:hypothetical protein
MLFRTCEAAANGSLGVTRAETAKNVREEHKQIIESLTQMLVTEEAKAIAQSYDAVANVVGADGAAKLDLQMFKSFSGINSNRIMRLALEKKRDDCKAKAADDKAKAVCEANHKKWLTDLGGQ